MTTTTPSPVTRSCDPATAVTKSLLGWGAVAGPLYVAVSLAQALTRDGFELSTHSWSLLENGPYGWVQSANLAITGAMLVAFGVGVGRATGSRWAARLLAAYGVSAIAAGIFTADPMDGFPVGMDETPTWHGALHLAAGGVGFLAMVAACLVLGRRFARAGSRGWALSARVTGIAFLAAFAGITTGSTAAVVPFAAGVVLSFGWLAALAVHLYKTA